jgi:transcriptional regulator with XRE-family HTH domain
MDLKELKDIRTRKGLTQLQVAKACGVSLLTYRLWEMGANEPNRKNYDALLSALDVVPFTDKEG